MTPVSTRPPHITLDLDAATAHLRERDPVLAALVERVEPYRLRPQRSLFEIMLGTIVSQQLSTRAADTIYGRLAAAMAPGRPRPAALLALTEAELRACGLSRSKAVYVRNVAESFVNERHTRRSFTSLEDAAVIERLTAIKGVGEWSAHMFLIFALQRPDVFPIGDLGLRKAMMQNYRLRANAKPARFHRIADVWRPWRSVATLYMWRSLDG
ncbi:MAG TPA: DNA-3-methyladenine glycosylase 2 family protein [Candidatus Krumholzibacteria bacterium]